MPRMHRIAMGDEYSDQLACIKIANASPWVSKMDAEIGKLASGWRPTGYYAPGDIRKLLDVLATQAADAGAALAGAPRSTGDAESQIQEAFNDLINRYQVRARLYEQDLANAAAQGINVINAPALKDWVLASMNAISSAYVTAVVMYCRQTWVESVLTRAYNAIAAIGRVAWGTLGIAYKVGAAVYHAADKAAGIIAAIVKYAPVIAVGVIGYFAYNEYDKHKNKRRLS